MAMTETTEAPEAEAEAPEVPPAVVPPWPPATDHKVVGTLFVVVALLFLVASGVLALVLRSELTTADAGVLGRSTYRELFTLHGVLAVFAFLAPAWVGVATAVVPLQIGAARLAFPRLQALALWMVVAGGGMVAVSPFLDGRISSGWTLSTPIPQGRAFRGDAVDLLVLGMVVLVVALVLAAVNLLVTVVKLRAPGVTLRRTPLFSWSVAVSSSVLLLALPVLVAGLVMLFVDRHYGGRVFNGFTGSGGGNPLLWPRIFWFAVYPALWALLLPALGVISEIVPVAAGRRLFSHARAVAALGAVGVLAFAGWGSEVNGLTRARVVFAVGALLVLLPVASLLLNWLVTVATSLRSRRTNPPALRTVPMLFAAGAISLLALGLAGAAVAAVGSGTTLHRNYWRVATQHTLYFGVGTLGVVTALAWWAPKLWGRRLNEKAGTLAAALLAGGLHLTFLPMFVLGVQDMRIHLAGYSDSDFTPANLVATGGAVLTALGVLVFASDLLASVVARRGRPAGDDPWQGHTLEWVTSSPPPSHNFERLPEVRSETPVLDLRESAVTTATDAEVAEELGSWR
jgi:cytochrome c oxidase subunit 1